MDIIKRAPDFTKLFPTQESFKRAHGEVVAMSDAMLSGDVKASIKALREAADPATLNKAQKTFNMRAFAHELLRTSQFKTVSSCEGRIANILITVPSTDRGTISARNERHYRRLISLMGGNRTYTILCRPSHIATIRTWFASIADVQVDFAYSPCFDYSIWAQDAYVALSGGAGQSLLIEGVCFPRYDDMTIADDLSAQTAISLIQSYLYFQGGNVLTSSDQVLIGLDYVWKNITRFGLATQQDVEREFEAVFGRSVLSLGSDMSSDTYTYELFRQGIFSGYGNQPLFHIDMFVTPTGIRGDSGKEIVLMGRPSATQEVLGRYCEVSGVDGGRIDRYFEPTEQLLSAHYEVRHLPICLTQGDLGGHAAQDYYWLTFNNVIHEEHGSGDRRVYMTTYSEDADFFGTDRALRQDLEDAAASVYESLGFTVLRMDGLEELAYGLGSVHCITKELYRIG
ncbi:hypothetical protein [Rhizobium azibense]|uniref:Arginine deiminase n=1 Tax=Rhizobium azibense TaxID=1136135 RepID=A0A4R3RFI0_9HYPH|nr:hypothetical protein [Rhizobium azibense]TCU33137.1 hypothetical protein EV129_117134 [Rhizobium azibense]